MEFTIRLKAPRGFKPLKVGIQNGRYYLWAEVLVDDNPDFTNVIYCVTTGGSIPDGSSYIDSIIDNDIGGVLHFYWYPSNIGDIKHDVSGN